MSRHTAAGLLRLGMAFDEEQTKRSVAELAAVTDAQLAADIRASIASVVTAWGIYRSHTDYPRRDAPGRKLADDRGALIATVERELAALPDDADLHTLQSLAGTVLGQVWPDRPAAAETVALVVNKLRIVAKVRPGLVRDARAVVDNA